MDVIVDSSAWIDFLIGRPAAAVLSAIADGSVVLAPLVVAEVLSGNITLEQRHSVGEFLQEFPLHPTPLAHWISVGELRRTQPKASTSRALTGSEPVGLAWSSIHAFLRLTTLSLRDRIRGIEYPRVSHDFASSCSEAAALYA